MTLFHSLWTGAQGFTLRRGPMLVHTLSVCMAKAAMGSISLITDDEGMSVADALGWSYRQVSNELQDEMTGVPPFIWAAGKLASFRFVAGRAVQIDTDVLVIRKLDACLWDAPLLAQNVDWVEHYGSRDMKVSMAAAGIPEGTLPYGCGVIGGEDGLIHEYASEGFSLTARFQGLSLNGTAASMAIEQMHLGSFAARRGITVRTLMPTPSSVEDFRKAGLIHLWGRSKHDLGMIVKAERRLATDFPREYTRFLEGWKRLGVG